VTWTVGPSSAAIRTLDRLPNKVLPAVIDFIFGPLATSPHEVGKPLGQDFAGLHSARRGAYRVIYEIDNNDHSVTVVRVAHRSEAYPPLTSDQGSSGARGFRL
jgi:mRNA interferase RelE/StbE